VKAGRVTVAHVRDLRGVLDREKAEIGVLLCMEEPTAPMRKEAANVGFYRSPWGQHPRLQILTIEDLLAGKNISRPPAQTSVTFKRAPKAVHKRRRDTIDAIRRPRGVELIDLQGFPVLPARRDRRRQIAAQAASRR